jgi:hypothetical protein
MIKPSTNPEVVFANKSEFRQFTRDQREFVVTRFNEDLLWLDGLEHLATVYNKGDPISGLFEITPAPNFGAGLETMLRHIITRYDSLSEITMFCQGTLLDRDDQPLYPLTWYFNEMPPIGVKGFLSEAYDRGNSRFPNRLSNSDCSAIKGRDLFTFRRDIVGINYKSHREWWVRGDWISATRQAIRKKPKAYYCWLYEACQFQRGIFTEELWYLERSWYSILTRPLERLFTYKPENSSVLLS